MKKRIEEINLENEERMIMSDSEHNTDPEEWVTTERTLPSLYEDEKKKLKIEHPSDYALVAMVLDIKKRHLNKNKIPTHYVYQLVSC